MYTDPTGEIIPFVIAALIGIAISSAVYTGVAIYNGNFSWTGLLASAFIGGLSGGVGAVAGISAAAALGVSGGVLGGFVSGAVGGLVGGAISGAGSSLLFGGSDIVQSIFTGAWQGALIGGAIGGIIGGVQTARANSALLQTNPNATPMNIFSGKPVAFGRSPWSLSNTPKIANTKISGFVPASQITSATKVEVLPLKSINYLENKYLSGNSQPLHAEDLRVQFTPDDLINSIREGNYDILKTGAKHAHVSMSENTFNNVMNDFSKYTSSRGPQLELFKSTYKFPDGSTAQFYGFPTSGKINGTFNWQPSFEIRNNAGNIYKLRINIE